jgi:hypothetical protein
MIVDALLRRLRDDVTGGWTAAEAAAGARVWLAGRHARSLADQCLCTLPLRWPFLCRRIGARHLKQVENISVAPPAPAQFLPPFVAGPE